jgi:hypothetical protein
MLYKQKLEYQNSLFPQMKGAYFWISKIQYLIINYL